MVYVNFADPVDYLSLQCFVSGAPLLDKLLLFIKEGPHVEEIGRVEDVLCLMKNLRFLQCTFSSLYQTNIFKALASGECPKLIWFSCCSPFQAKDMLSFREFLAFRTQVSHFVSLFNSFTHEHYFHLTANL